MRRFVGICAAVVGGANDATAPSVSSVRLDVVVVVLLMARGSVNRCILVITGERVLGSLLNFMRWGSEVIERRDGVLFVVPCSVTGDSSGCKPQEPEEI